ncbi:hypothetical protein GGD46_004111 [Rhizobium lusitanum]|uniref:Uncharacterized protein n=1 Tax=Rhizobium lusitanum TaxID=293958 RepID=A0A7X0IVL6_9HYPH|nr:hypothetical protein [Rhizobium lusitanum]
MHEDMLLVRPELHGTGYLRKETRVITICIMPAAIATSCSRLHNEAATAPREGFSATSSCLNSGRSSQGFHFCCTASSNVGLQKYYYMMF